LYDATHLMQSILVMIYHLTLTSALYVFLKNNDIKTLNEEIRQILYYKLVPFQLAITLALGAVISLCPCMFK